MPAPFTDTAKGYPYILGTQNASLVDDWALQLATKLDNTVPMAFAAGQANLSLSAASTANVTVTLPVGRFNVAPLVLVTIASAATGTQKLVARAINATTTNFALYVYTGDSTNTTATVTVSWMAIQMTSTTAAG